MKKGARLGRWGWCRGCGCLGGVGGGSTQGFGGAGRRLGWFSEGGEGAVGETPEPRAGEERYMVRKALKWWH